MTQQLELARRHCAACEGGQEALTLDAARALLRQLPDWTLAEDGQSIHRDFVFKNFDATISFVNAVAWLARREDHHPDMEVGYRHCHVHYSTHAIGGLSDNDFICAAKIDQLLD